MAQPGSAEVLGFAKNSTQLIDITQKILKFLRRSCSTQGYLGRSICAQQIFGGDFMKYNVEAKNSLFAEVKRLFLVEGLSSREITDKLGGRVAYTSVKTYIAQIVGEAKNNGVHIPPRRNKREPRRTKPISPLHLRVGIALMQDRILKHASMPPSEYAQMHELGNRGTIPLMEKGVYEFTLGELQRIATAIGKSVPELLTHGG
jgi:hypothetical protein